MLNKVIFNNSKLAVTSLRMFSGATPPPISNGTPSSNTKPKSELNIQYENAEFGVNTSPS